LVIVLFRLVVLVDADSVDPEQSSAVEGSQSGEDAIHVWTDANFHTINPERHGPSSGLSHAPRDGLVRLEGCHNGHVDQGTFKNPEVVLGVSEAGFPFLD
jgi:hypothetical protein